MSKIIGIDLGTAAKAASYKVCKVESAKKGTI